MTAVFKTIVSAETLIQHATDQDWIVFDVRHELSNPEAGRIAYAAGHIPGATFLHLDDDLSASKTGKNGRHPLPDIDAFASTMARLGVSRQSQVVVYDAQGGMMAGRLWWMLKWIGHDAVAVLDGGWQAWLAAGGLPETVLSVRHTPGDLQRTRSNFSVVNAEQVLANLSTKQRLVVDARGDDRFRGENETMDPVGGHIPGARNRPFRSNLTTGDKFKSPETLREEWLIALEGYEPSQMIAQCGSGVTACHNLLAMEIAGLSGAVLYAGSWSEWCADSSRPVAKG